MSGQFTNLRDDNCAIQARECRSHAPYDYNMYRGKYVNCGRCQVVQPQHVSLIDTESDLHGLTRSASLCNQNQYNPNQKNLTGGSLSTFSPLAPVSLPPQVCPDAERLLYFNSGLLRPTGVGVRFPNPNVCALRV